jgi:cysteine desulfurase
MYANNETGQIFALEEIAAQARALNPEILIHSDAVQAIGKTAFNFSSLGLDMITVSGHKLGALSGVGALVLKNGFEFEPQILGGPQEQYLRAGTENVLGIVSLGEAAKHIRKNLKQRIACLGELKKEALEIIGRDLPQAVVHCRGISSLPNTLSLRIPGILADDLVVAMDLEGVLISSGAACASGKPEPSHVLVAYGLSPAEARETIRLSFTAELSLEDLRLGLKTLVHCVKRMQA